MLLAFLRPLQSVQLEQRVQSCHVFLSVSRQSSPCKSSRFCRRLSVVVVQGEEPEIFDSRQARLTVQSSQLEQSVQSCSKRERERERVSLGVDALRGGKVGGVDLF